MSQQRELDRGAGGGMLVYSSHTREFDRLMAL